MIWLQIFEKNPTKLKNYGILQVIDSEKLAGKSADKTANKGVSVNLILENLGATNKGKIKVVVDKSIKDGGDPTKPVVVATPAAETPAAETPASGGSLPKNTTSFILSGYASPSVIST